MAVSLIYLCLLCTNIHHGAILFWCAIMKMHLRTDSSIKRERKNDFGLARRVCVCVFVCERHRERSRSSYLCTVLYTLLSSFFFSTLKFYWNSILISARVCTVLPPFIRGNKRTQCIFLYSYWIAKTSNISIDVLFMRVRYNYVSKLGRSKASREPEWLSANPV